MSLYLAYNTYIQSEIDLSPIGAEKVSSANLNHSIRIRIVDHFPSGKELLDNQTSVSEESGFYYRKGVAYFEFLSGYEILVSPLCNKFDVDFLRILLNYPIACIFFQKGFYLLHAGCVEFNKKVYLFPGQSMSGKSTLAAFFLKNGAKLITEDTAVIKLAGSEAIIYPSYPFLKISKNANQHLKLFSDEGLRLIKDKNNRRGHILNSERFRCEAVKINFCIFPFWDDCEEFERSNASSAMVALLNSSLTIYPLNRKRETQLFALNMRFARCVTSYDFRRPRDFNLMKSAINAIIKQIN